MQARTQRRLFALAIVFAYLYPFPYFAQIRSANELPRAYLTMAMIEEGTFRIDTGVKRHGTTVDVSPTGGHFYSNKAPGSSMLAIPGHLLLKAWTAIGGRSPTLAETVWMARVSTGVVPTLLFLLLFWRFLGRFTSSEAVRRTAVLAYGLGSMAMTYSLLFIAHQLSAVFVGTSMCLIAWFIKDGLDRRWLVAAGAAAGAAVLCDYQAAFACVPLAVWLCVHLGKTRDVRGLALAAAGAAVPIAVLLIYHWQAFGDPLKTGYHASETFAHFHQRGFLGLDKFRLEALAGSTIAADNGLLIFSPFLCLAPVGWVLLWRAKNGTADWTGRDQNRDLAIVSAATALIMLAFISSIAFWRGGWQLGPRYVTAMLPAVMVGVTVALDCANKRWWTWGIALGLVLVGVFVYASSSSQFPHFPEKFANPLYEVTLALYRDGYAPTSLGTVFGLTGFAAQLPFILAVLSAVGFAVMPSRERWRAPLLGVAVALAIVLLYSQFDDGGPTAARAYDYVKSVYP